MDERFLLHRYKSTSHAGVVAAVFMGGWFFYDQVAHDTLRWDFLIVLAVMAVVKVAFLVWYRTRE